jgi:hypothetical protein
MLTERMQLSAIHRLVYTDDPLDDIQPELFQEPWRTVYLMTERQIDSMDPYAALHSALCRAYRGDGDKWQWASDQAARVKASGEPMFYQSYADLRGKLPPISWLWEPWIPRGMMTLAAGFPGAGKTWLALDIARAVLRGKTWPDGKPLEKPGRVIYIEGEAVPQISVARIEKMGLTGEDIFPMLPESGEILNLTTLSYQHRLIDMVMELQPELIVVDSLSDVDDGGQNSKEEVQHLLRFLVDLARQGDCGLLVLHHLKKPANGQQFQLVTMHDLRGSGYIAAQGRVIWGYSVVSSSGFDLKDGKRHLQIMKTNLDQWADAMGVDLVDLPGGGKKLVYGEAPNLEASTSRDDCGGWLIEFLQENGPSKVKAVLNAALEAGYSRDVVYRARKELEGRIVNTKGHKHPGNQWTLSEDGGERVEDSEDSEESDTLCQPSP